MITKDRGNKMVEFNSKYATNPGEIILDYLDFYGFSQKWLAERLGCTEKHICKILSGEASISADIAVKLSTVIGSTADFWLSLENSYKIYKARLAQEEQAENEAKDEIYTKIPYSDLVKLNWVKPTRKPVERVLNLYSYFNISSLSLIKNTQDVAFRKTANDKIDDYAVAAWLQRGENIVKNKKFNTEYSEQKLRDSIDDILDVVYEMPNDFFRRTVDILSKCGVILIAVEYLKGTYINGATRWIGNNPVIQLSDRGKNDDIVWFTLFHEIGHVIKHGKKEQFLNIEMKDTNEKEKEADSFASEMLLSSKMYKLFLERHDHNISKENIFAFSKEYKISPSILVGRLKHDNIISYSMFPRIHKKVIVEN